MRGTAFTIAVLAACGPPAAPAQAPVVEAPREAGRLAAVSPVALAAGGGTVYYADLEGVWALPVAGGDARLVTAPAKMAERLVPHEDELVLVLAGEVLAVPIAGGPARRVHEGAADAIAVDDDGVWFVDGTRLRVVPLAGGAARTVADIGAPVAPLVTDGAAVYAAVEVADDRALSFGREDVRAAAILRIAKPDGARTQLARRQLGVAALARRGDRLYWTSFAAGLRSVATSGGTIRTELGGGGVALAADADGIVVQTTSGLWIEVRPDGARVALGTAGRMPERSPGLVLAGGAIVALVSDPESSTQEVWREPRPWRSSTITVAGWVTDRLRELIATDDGVIVLDALLDEEATGRILRIDGRGRRSVLATARRMSGLAVAGDTIAYRAGDAIWRKDGTAAPVRAVTVGDELVLGLVLAGDTFYWSDSQGVRTAPGRGGAPSTLYDDPRMRSLGTGKPYAQLVVDGKTVYVNQLGWGGHGVLRVVDATTTHTLYEPPEDVWTGQELVRAGDALYVTTSANQVVRVPLAGGGARVVAKGGEYPFQTLVAGGDRIVTEYWSEAGETLAVVEPLAGKVTPVAVFPTDSSLVTAVTPAGDAVYVGLDASDLIVRVPLPPAR